MNETCDIMWQIVKSGQIIMMKMCVGINNSNLLVENTTVSNETNITNMTFYIHNNPTNSTNNPTNSTNNLTNNTNNLTNNTNITVATAITTVTSPITDTETYINTTNTTNTTNATIATLSDSPRRNSLPCSRARRSGGSCGRPTCTRASRRR